MSRRANDADFVRFLLARRKFQIVAQTIWQGRTGRVHAKGGLGSGGQTRLRRAPARSNRTRPPAGRPNEVYVRCGAVLGELLLIQFSEVCSPKCTKTEREKERVKQQPLAVFIDYITIVHTKVVDELSNFIGGSFGSVKRFVALLTPRLEHVAPIYLPFALDVFNLKRE